MYQGGSFEDGYYPAVPSSTANPFQPGLLSQGMILVVAALAIYLWLR